MQAIPKACPARERVRSLAPPLRIRADFLDQVVQVVLILESREEPSANLTDGSRKSRRNPSLRSSA